MELGKGMRVEVCSSEDGYIGAWFQGVILAVTAEGQRCTIQYDKFVTDDGKPLVEEEVCLLSHVRPIPPSTQLPRHCSAGDAVEAYDTDCWWRGVIIRLLSTAEEELWVVYFPDSSSLKAYRRSDLRPAQEWLGENWRLVPQEKSPITEQVIRSITLDNSEETPPKSQREGNGKKRRRDVKFKPVSLVKKASGKRKKQKITVDKVSLLQAVQENSEIQ